jgi:hypothetical protein
MEIAAAGYSGLKTLELAKGLEPPTV